MQTDSGFAPYFYDGSPAAQTMSRDTSYSLFLLNYITTFVVYR